MVRTAHVPAGERCTVDLEGESIEARAGEPVAASLLAAGVTTFSRSVKYHRPRGAYCLSGACGQCLMQVDGIPNVATCRVPARAGMKLQRQNAFPSGDVDIFEAVDWLFPRGMDHHEMFAGVPVAETVMLHVARALAGLGTLPPHAAPPRQPAESDQVDAVVVGAGPAGLGAAAALVSAGRTVRVLEREPVTGGQLASGFPADPPAALPALPDGTVLSHCAALGLFNEGGTRFIGAVSHAAAGPVLRKVEAPAIVVATGGYPALLPFENNDLPGVYAGAAVAVLLRRHGVRAGNAVACVGEGPGLHLLARALKEAGAEVPLVLQLSGDLPPDALPTARVGTPLRASGLHHVKALTFGAGGAEDRVSCDAVAVVLPPSPALELARQGGAQVGFLEAWNVFAVQAGPDGSTGVPGLYAAGHVTGPMSATEALAAGTRAGEAAAAWLARREAP